MQTVVASLALVSALLAIMELYVKEGSSARLVAATLYKYFNSATVKGFPMRVVGRYREKTFYLNKSLAEVRGWMFFSAINVLMLAPITIYRGLPWPMPSRLFNFSPLLYYGLVLASILAFLRTMARAMKNNSAPSILAVLGFLTFFVLTYLI